MRFAVPCSLGLLGLLVAGASAAPPPPESAGYGDTYTPEELAALDRALHAGNLDRHDLTFRKALTDGHGAFPVAREMLRDPLLIASEMDTVVARLDGEPGPARATRALFVAASTFEAGRTSWHTADGPQSPPTAIGGPPVADVDTPEALLSALVELVACRPHFTATADIPADKLEVCVNALREKLPAEMAWHDVFANPDDEATQAAVLAWAKDASPAALHEVADALTRPGDVTAWTRAFGLPETWLTALPASAFPTDAPVVRQTSYGRIALGTPGDDVWTGDYAVLIDPGGNDRYLNCRIGAAFGTAGSRVGFFADLGGDDVYDCADVNITLGAAVLGVAAFYDLGAGNDRYVAGHCSLGAAVGGTAVFYDDGGSDVYEGRTYTQGAAGFGIGIFYDDAVQERPVMTSDEGTKEPVVIGQFDNDRLTAWGNAQAFARPRGVAFCINSRGNEIYEAGGVYLDAPLFADRYQSFSQGFAIGSREIDWAGGIALVVDRDGNDRYLGDIYNQGVGYWYGAGLLWDGGGNDTYEMTQYGQGSGIHLAVGGLVDVAGNDTYVMHSGLGQGGSHDYASGILHDRGGNDHYHGSTSCNGCGLTNSVGIHIDRAGDDLYGARANGGFNGGRPARDFPSIGVLIDLGGKDDYLGDQADGTTWRHPDIGVGVDVTPPDQPPGPAAGAPDKVTGNAEIPAVCHYEGELTQEAFDELWEIAVRWEVGDNRVIVPEARKRLVAFGADILPLLDAKVETDNSGLELRAFVDVLRGISEGGADAAVLAFIRKNAEEGNERRKRVALYLVGEMKPTGLEDTVAAVLSGEDAGMARRAAGVLALLGSHAGDDTLSAWLAGDDDRAQAAAVACLVDLEADVYPALRRHLASSDFAVRGRLVTLLAKHIAAYGDAVVADLGAHDLSPRAVRSLLDVLARAAKSPPAGAAPAVEALFAAGDAGIRRDAVRVVRAWDDVEGLDLPGLPGLVAAAEHVSIEDPESPAPPHDDPAK